MTPRLRLPFMRDPHDCEEVRELMSDYVDEELEPASKQRVEAHVGGCVRCRRVLANLRTTLDRLAHLSDHRAVDAAEPDEDERAAERISAGWRDRSG